MYDEPDVNVNGLTNQQTYKYPDDEEDEEEGYEDAPAAGRVGGSRRGA